MNPSIIQDTTRRVVSVSVPKALEEGAPEGGDPPLRKLADNLCRLKQAVLARRPVFKEIIDTHGQKSVYRYVSEYTAFITQPGQEERKTELVNAFRSEVETRLGTMVAMQAAEQLEHYYYASTTDHFGPLHNPWVLNFNLVTALTYLEHPDPVLKNIITLACSNVSLNNFSFPRGLSFTSDTTGCPKAQRLSFLPSNAHSCAVFNFRPYTSVDIKKIKTLLAAKKHDGEISADQSQAMAVILDDVCASPDILACKNYADQVTKINFALWNRLMQGQKKTLNFVYIEQERLVSRLLLDHHLSQDSLIHRLVFDRSEQTLLARYFDGLPDAFSIAKKCGTYLFWAQLPGEHLRHQLWKDGDALVSSDGTYRIALEPEAIAGALRRGELIPSVLLTFITLCFYYGLKCLGGMGQVSYLPVLQAAYVRMQTELGNAHAAEQCQVVPVKRLGGEITVAFVQCHSGKLAPATSLDLLLYGDSQSLNVIAQQAKSLTLAESLNPTLPTEYPMLYRGEERDKTLYDMTPQDIALVLQHSGKIRACAKM